MKKEYIEVTLNSSATIVEFKNTFSNLGYTEEEVIGKNWFHLFIDDNNIIEVLEVFNSLFLKDSKNWNTYKNDIKCKNGSHKSIDFSNKIVDINGEKFMKFKGVEHYS